MRACSGANFCVFSFTYVLRIKGTSDTSNNLPAFFTNISSNTATIAPTTKTQMGIYTIEAVVTPNYSSVATFTYSVLTLTIGCVITSV